MSVAARIFSVFALAALACACARTPDAQAIRDAITRGADAAQAHDPAPLLALLADDFIGNDELDKVQLKTQLRGQFVVAKAVGVHVGAVTVDVQGDRATARFDAVVTDTSGRWIPDRATTLHFETGWRRERGGWLCNNAHWTRD